MLLAQSRCLEPAAEPAEGKVHLFVAIDRVSKFTVVELHPRATSMIGAAFLRGVVATFPYKRRAVLTDNGVAFPDQPARPPFTSLSEARAARGFAEGTLDGTYWTAAPNVVRNLVLGAGRPAFATGNPLNSGGVVSLTSEAGVGAADRYDDDPNHPGTPTLLDLGRLDVFGGKGVLNNPLLFVTGVVYEDGDGDGQYSPGEGLAGVTVQPDRGDWAAITSASGGYAIPLSAIADAPVNRQVGPPLAAGGTLTLTFSGGGLREPVTRTVVRPATAWRSTSSRRAPPAGPGRTWWPPSARTRASRPAPTPRARPRRSCTVRTVCGSSSGGTGRTPGAHGSAGAGCGAATMWPS